MATKLIALSVLMIVGSVFLTPAVVSATDTQLTITDLQDMMLGLRFVWSLPRSRVLSLPRWNPTEGDAPLSPKQAAVAATRFVRSHLPADSRLTIFEISLGLAGTGRDYQKPELQNIWVYQIAFRCDPPAKPSDRPLLNVMVLLDGTVITPNVSPLSAKPSNQSLQPTASPRE